jgi:hypothetical protein
MCIINMRKENAMKITRIDFAGWKHTIVSVTRKIGSEFIYAEILSMKIICRRHAKADDRDSVFELAREIQEHLDGCKGTNSMIHEYFSQIQLLAD